VGADWQQLRLAASVLLMVYLGTMVAFLPRELRFLKLVEPPTRRLFLFQDILLQASILAVLLPCVVASGPSAPFFMTVAVAFTTLWIAAVWTGIVRSMYTYRLMLGTREQHGKMAEELSRLLAQAKEDKDD
jgi:hypothetical protein